MEIFRHLQLCDSLLEATSICGSGFQQILLMKQTKCILINEHLILSKSKERSRRERTQAVLCKILKTLHFLNTFFHQLSSEFVHQRGGKKAAYFRFPNARNKCCKMETKPLRKQQAASKQLKCLLDVQMVLSQATFPQMLCANSSTQIPTSYFIRKKGRQKCL